MSQRTSLDVPSVRAIPAATTPIDGLLINPEAAAALLEMLRAARSEQSVPSQSQLAA
jgi:hypothetical protein